MLLEPGRSRGTTEYKYVYDDFGRQIYENKTVDIRSYHTYYTYGYGMETRRTGSGISELRYLHKDILGSITAVSDDYGRVSTELEYSPFGELISGSASSLGNFAFTGQDMDWDVNLYHFPARYYEPLWGRFLTPDPYTNLPDDARIVSYQPYIIRNNYYFENAGIPRAIGDDIVAALNNPRCFYLQNFNTYTYAMNNPAINTDPFGYGPDPRDCINVFLNCMAEHLVMPGWSNFTIGTGEVIGAYYYSKALAHAASRALTYPLKSSIFRHLAFWGKHGGAYFLLGTVIAVEAICLYAEYQCLKEMGYF